MLVLGDSVMKGAATRYAAALPGREVVVSAEVNRTTGQGADELARLGSDWDAVVILLGHNDGASPGAYQPAARRILDQLRGVPLVSWLTIHEVRPYYPEVNQYIASLRPEHPNLVVGDWNAIANANPGAVAADGLHLSGAGADLMAGLVAEQVRIGEFRWALALDALAPTTTTTAPPTTTTTPPTTTSTAPDPEPEVSLLPAITVDNTSPPTTTAATSDDPGSDDEPTSGAPIAAVTVALAAATSGALVRRRARRRAAEADDT